MKVYEEYIRAHAVMEVGSRNIATGKYGGLRIFVDYSHAERWIANREKWEIVPIYIIIEVPDGGTTRSAEKTGEYKGARGDERKRDDTKKD
jgi:hypothetical protein